MRRLFRRFAQLTSVAVGSPGAFLLATAVVLVWLVTGPMFHFSDSWQLIINTGTTIVTFLMVFLIQNTQNRESKAMQLKLDELLRSLRTARNSMIDVENLSDDELKELEEEFHKIRERFRHKAR